MSKITMIKKDAVVDIKIGSGFLQMLQKVMLHLIEGKSKEDLNVFSDAVKANLESGEEFPEMWMYSLYTISTLVSQIEKALISGGHTYESTVEDSISTEEN